jgi:Fe-S cluster assembly protein SufD
MVGWKKGLPEHMSDFQQQAVQLAAQQQAPEWLSALRYAGAEQWLQAGWPTRKTELWKYTPLMPLQKSEFSGWGDATHDWQAKVELPDIDATRLVFVNGVLDRAASDDLPEQVSLFSEADEQQQAVIRQHLGKILNTERHLFAALSNAWVSEGVLLYVSHGTALEKPLCVVHVSTPQTKAAVSCQRILLVLEESASAEVIEHYVSSSEQQNSFVNTLTEIHVGANAELKHCRINLEQEDLMHIGGVHADLHRDARLYGFTIAEGSRLKRIDYQVNHRGEGAHLGLKGIYLARNRQLVDYHTNLEHVAGHCTSDEVFRGIIGDSAKAVFNGRIHIHPDAQKTLAELSNRNLLTSNSAEIDTKPELEIYADDVRCAHGATVSQLDATALYYLQSRGVPQDQARVMLSLGFVNELLTDVPQPTVREFLHQHLTRLLYNNESLVSTHVIDETRQGG